MTGEDLVKDYAEDNLKRSTKIFASKIPAINIPMIKITIEISIREKGLVLDRGLNILIF